MQQKNKKFFPARVIENCLSYAEDINVSLSSFSLEMPDSKHLTARGIQRIVHYSPQKISLALKKGYINVCGKALSCFAFSVNDVGIEGEIKCVFFSSVLHKGGKR